MYYMNHRPLAGVAVRRTVRTGTKTDDKGASRGSARRMLAAPSDAQEREVEEGENEQSWRSIA